MAGNNDVYFPGGAPPDPSGSGTQNDYSTGKNYDRDGGSAASPPTVAAWQVQDPGKGYSVKPDVLNQVASALQEDINNTQTMLQNLQGMGSQLQAAMGQWPTGQSFGYMAQDALTQVQQIHQKLLQAHATVVQSLQTTAAQYSGTEAANTATVNTVDPQTSSSGPVQAS